MLVWSRETTFPSIPRNSTTFGERKWQRSSVRVFEPGFHEPSGQARALDKRQEDEFERLFSFFRELPRDPTLSGRHAKIEGFGEGRGTKGDIEDAFISHCEDVRAHKKTGPALPLRVRFPSAIRGHGNGSKVAAAAGCERGRCRFLNPANETR